MRPSRPSRRPASRISQHARSSWPWIAYSSGGEAAQHVADREQRREQVDPSPERVPLGAPLAGRAANPPDPHAAPPGGEARDGGEARSRALAGAHLDRSVPREEEIHARAELDQADALAPGNGLARARGHTRPCAPASRRSACTPRFPARPRGARSCAR